MNRILGIYTFWEVSFLVSHCSAMCFSRFYSVNYLVTLQNERTQEHSFYSSWSKLATWQIMTLLVLWLLVQLCYFFFFFFNFRYNGETGNMRTLRLLFNLNYSNFKTGHCSKAPSHHKSKIYFKNNLYIQY